jgi:hypothetical protein
MPSLSLPPIRREHVEGAAGGERHDDAHRPARIGFGARMFAAERGEQKQGSQGDAHPHPFTIASA